MRIIKGLLVIVVLTVVVFLAGFELVYREKERNFFKEDIRQVYVNRGIRKHNYDTVKKILKESGRERVWEKVEKTSKVVKGIYLLSYDRIDNNLEQEVAVIDTGLAYLGIRAKLTDYFYREGEYFLMKDELKPDELKGMDIYLKPHRGYFILGLSPEIIDHFIEGSEGVNDNLAGLDKESDNGLLGKVVMDLSGDQFFSELGIRGAVTDGELVKGRLSLSNELYGAGALTEALGNQPEERTYAPYAGTDRVYISGNNIGDTMALMVRAVNPRELDTLNMMFGMLGVTVEDIFNQIDGEIIVDVRRNSWLIPLKETKGIKRIFGFFGEKDRMFYGERELRLDGDLLMSGEMTKRDEEREIEREHFLYGDLPMELFDKMFGSGARGLLTGKTSKKGILMKLELNEEATKDFLEETLK